MPGEERCPSLLPAQPRALPAPSSIKRSERQAQEPTLNLCGKGRKLRRPIFGSARSHTTPVAQRRGFQPDTSPAPQCLLSRWPRHPGQGASPSRQQEAGPCSMARLLSARGGGKAVTRDRDLEPRVPRGHRSTPWLRFASTWSQALFKGFYFSKYTAYLQS